jgi:hypothetical protein
MERELIDSNLVKNYKRYKLLVTQLLNQYTKLNAEQRVFKTDEHSWSAAHVYQHLIQVEQMCHKTIAARITGGVYHTSKFKHTWRYFLLTSALKLPRNFKVPKTAPLPIHALEVDESTIVRDWNAVNEDFENFVNHFPARLKNKLLYKHPIAGPLKASQAIGFLNVHLKHHLRQLRKIRKHPLYPN